jgi:CRISPR/Cas system-associated exonuclease Cas4 (RecB family)
LKIPENNIDASIVFTHEPIGILPIEEIDIEVNLQKIKAVLRGEQPEKNPETCGLCPHKEICGDYLPPEGG